MATVPSPRTWAVGELLTAAKLNTDLRDGLNFLLAPPLAVLTKGSQTITNNTATLLSWTAETLDRDNGHDNATNNTRYTAQTAGWYDCREGHQWSTAASSTATAGFVKNGGASYIAPPDIRPFSSVNGVTNIVSGLVYLSVGDYVEVNVNQGSGGSLTLFGTNALFTVGWVST